VWVGSGVDGSRVKVCRLLADPDVTAVVIGHRDWLGRMNTELVEAALWAHGRRLVVPGDGGPGDDLAGNMAGVLTWFCACRYGRGPAVNRALKAVGCGRRDTGLRAVSAGNVVAGGQDGGVMTGRGRDGAGEDG
jgi:putative resolvase